MRTGLFALGMTTAVAQVVLMRELVATFYGNELLLGLVLAVWLVWVAVGSWGLARLFPTGRIKRGQVVFSAGLGLAAVILPAQLCLVRSARTLLGVTPGALVALGPTAAVAVLVLAPMCLLSGFLFVLGTRLVAGAGAGPGQAYVWESLGAVAGGGLVSLVLLYGGHRDPFQIGLLASSVSLACGLRLLLRPPGLPGLAARRSISLILPLGLLILVALLALPLGRALHQATLLWDWPDLAAAVDSPYGRLTVQARGGQRAFYTNGLLAFETQGTFAEEVVHFPLLAHPAPQEVLLVGGGVAGNLGEILKHPVRDVAYVELDPVLIEVALAHLPAGDVAALHDPRVDLILADGRAYVESTDQTFDVVILDVPPPATGALNRFYTLEFFQQVGSVLKPGGIFALGLPAAENYWTPELARRNGSVYHTLGQVFPHMVVLPGEHIFFVVSDEPLIVEGTFEGEAPWAILARRLADRGIETGWVTAQYVEYVFTTDRFVQVRQELEGMEGVRLNRDLEPICYYYDLVLWFSRFYPHLRGAFERAGLLNLGWVALPMAAAVVLARWRRKLAVPLAVAAMGLAGMLLEVVILFTYQVLHGTVYAQVSLIVAAVMAGLALGGTASNRWLAIQGAAGGGVRGPENAASSPIHPGQARRTLLLILAFMLGFSGVLALLLLSSVPLPRSVFLLLALLSGGLGGMAFPAAVAAISGDVGRAVGLLYGADLLGGCLGALTGAAFLVPVLGIPRSCAVVALAALTGMLALT